MMSGMGFCLLLLALFLVFAPTFPLILRLREEGSCERSDLI
jgi:hypothetical protein